MAGSALVHNNLTAALSAMVTVSRLETSYCWRSR